MKKRCEKGKKIGCHAIWVKIQTREICPGNNRWGNRVYKLYPIPSPAISLRTVVYNSHEDRQVFISIAKIETSHIFKLLFLIFSPFLTCAKWGVRFINPLPIPHPTSATSDYIVGSIVPAPLLPSIHPIVPEGEGFSYSPLITREVRGGRRRKGGGVASH